VHDASRTLIVERDRGGRQLSVTVWGTGADASYGYGAGIGSRPLDEAPPPLVQ